MANLYKKENQKASFETKSLKKILKINFSFAYPWETKHFQTSQLEKFKCWDEMCHFKWVEICSLGTIHLSSHQVKHDNLWRQTICWSEENKKGREVLWATDGKMELIWIKLPDLTPAVSPELPCTETLLKLKNSRLPEVSNFSQIKSNTAKSKFYNWQGYHNTRLKKSLDNWLNVSAPSQTQSCICLP